MVATDASAESGCTGSRAALRAASAGAFRRPPAFGPAVGAGRSRQPAQDAADRRHFLAQGPAAVVRRPSHVVRCAAVADLRRTGPVKVNGPPSQHQFPPGSRALGEGRGDGFVQGRPTRARTTPLPPAPSEDPRPATEGRASSASQWPPWTGVLVIETTRRRKPPGGWDVRRDRLGVGGARGVRARRGGPQDGLVRCRAQRRRFRRLGASAGPLRRAVRAAGGHREGVDPRLVDDIGDHLAATQDVRAVERIRVRWIGHQPMSTPTSYSTPTSLWPGPTRSSRTPDTACSTMCPDWPMRCYTPAPPTAPAVIPTPQPDTTSPPAERQMPAGRVRPGRPARQPRSAQRLDLTLHQHRGPTRANDHDAQRPQQPPETHRRYYEDRAIDQVT
jgi:hypothetical protein